MNQIKTTLAPKKGSLKEGKKADEDRLQAACFRHWNKFYRRISVLFSVPNGAFLGEDKHRAMIELNKLKATGLTPGVSDLILLSIGAKTTFFELKTETGRQEDEQIRFEKKVVAMGFEYVLIRSVDVFIHELLTRLGPYAPLD